MNKFETIKTFGAYGRAGILHTRAGDVYTPTFMPDGTRGAVKGLTPEQVASTGVQVVLANTYHLHLAPGESVIRSLGGLHSFANRQGPMLTDSGGFQVFSLGKHTKITEEGVHFRDPKTGDKHFISPEDSMRIQIDLGADMIVAFDHLVGLGGESAADVKDAFERTHRWLARCTKEFNKLTTGMADADKPILFGVVQGGLDLDLRRKSLDIIQGSDVGGIAIGGLSVGETRIEMTEVLESLAAHFDPDRARFLLGVGTPEDLHIAIANGIDMLDCVLPTRNARHATVWTTDSKKIHLTNEQFTADSSVIEPGCTCYACASAKTNDYRCKYPI
jgi:queuine tRNA-ribosyltransferase